eukprot:scaffold93179_cov72-Phaeocystis_antarctica.AAC.4
MHRVHGRADDSPNASKPPEHSRAVRRSGSAHPAERAWACSWRECSSHGHCARGYEENEEVRRSHGPGERRDHDRPAEVRARCAAPGKSRTKARVGRGLYPGA